MIGNPWAPQAPGLSLDDQVLVPAEDLHQLRKYLHLQLRYHRGTNHLAVQSTFPAPSKSSDALNDQSRVNLGTYEKPLQGFTNPT